MHFRMALKIQGVTAWALFVYSVFLQETHCFQWAGQLQDGDQVSVCDGSDLSLVWTPQYGSGESLADIKWFFKGTGQEVLIAIYTTGVFLPSTPFSHRVTQQGMAGIHISHMVPADSGNYTAEVNVRMAPDATVKYRSTVAVNVLSDSSQGVTLSVAQDSIFPQYQLQLTCRSPFDVIWTTPKDETLQPTGYENGVYTLRVPNPIVGGEYTCKIAPDSPAASCLQSDNALLRGESVTVDAVATRLLLLETQLRALMGENQLLNSEITRLKACVGSCRR